jgi:hypothetical protein
MTNGMKTSEFWLSLGLSLLGFFHDVFLPASAGVLGPKTGLVVAAVSGAAYTISRGLAKGGNDQSAVPNSVSVPTNAVTPPPGRQ